MGSDPPKPASWCLFQAGEGAYRGACGRRAPAAVNRCRPFEQRTVVGGCHAQRTQRSEPHVFAGVLQAMGIETPAGLPDMRAMRRG